MGSPRKTLFQQDKDLASAYRRLVRAGFKSSVVVSVLKRFAKNPELLDGIEENPEQARHEPGTFADARQGCSDVKSELAWQLTRDSLAVARLT
jgi:hypothetical protein